MNSIATAKSELFDLTCTCGRDRTLQLFGRNAHDIKLIQTLDDHAASVTDLMFHDEGSTLISISSDRTVLVRKAAYGGNGSIAFLQVRAITLKASPVSVSTFQSSSHLTWRVSDDPKYFHRSESPFGTQFIALRRIRLC